MFLEFMAFLFNETSSISGQVAPDEIDVLQLILLIKSSNLAISNKLKNQRLAQRLYGVLLKLI